MAVRELAIQRLGGKFWGGRFGEWEERAMKGGRSEESLL